MQGPRGFRAHLHALGPAQFLNRLCALSYILFFTGGLWAWMLYFGLLFYGGWVVRALLILCAPCALALAVSVRGAY
jgi:hypothetical protein